MGRSDIGQPSEKDFKDFLFTEYENIARAHFESQKQMALFFRYYTIFFSVPIVVASFWNGTDSAIFTTNIFGGMLIIVGLIGVSFFWITIELKHEAVLYARTVNGIRFYFYKSLSKKLRKKIQTLPINIRKPSYYSPWSPVLMIMILVNCLYFVLGLQFLKLLDNCFSITGIVIVFASHFVLNKALSMRQERKFSDKRFLGYS